MKQLLLFLLLLLGVSAISQPTVTIQPTSVTTCSGSNTGFKVFVQPDTVSYTLTWKRNGVSIVNPDTSGFYLYLKNVSYADSGYYTCNAAGPYGTGHSDTVHLHIRPSLTIDTLYRYNALGCPGTCKGQMKTLISGGNPPYIYDWGGGHSQDTIVYGLCKGTYTLNVTDIDNTHCVSKEYTIDVLRLPRITFQMDPEDTVYLTNPYLRVSFPDSSARKITNWEWNFGDSTRLANVNPVTHVYSKTGMFLVSLNYTDLNGCDTTITDSITVKAAKLHIPNVFSPNSDGKNDCFVIQEATDRTIDLAEIYLSIELKVVNRWGRVVYHNTNYKCKDCGQPNCCEGWNGEGLADGVYFYELKCHGYYEDDNFHGSVTILR
jgi:hypothetical protein